METVEMVTTQYVPGLAELYMFQTQELDNDMKECREVNANNDTQEKFDEINVEVSLLNKN